MQTEQEMCALVRGLNIDTLLTFVKVPALGKHYSQRWAQEDLLEEQREGARANDKKKSMMGPLSELDAKGQCVAEENQDWITKISSSGLKCRACYCP